MRPIDLLDYLLIAEAVTGVDAEVLASRDHLVARAESALAAPFAEFDGVGFYDGLTLRAAVLCSRLIRNHPLPDGNKRCAYLAMIELIRRNDREWQPRAGVDEIVQQVERLAARVISEKDFATWVAGQIS